jgi:stage V sporulation protein R
MLLIFGLRLSGFLEEKMSNWTFNDLEQWDEKIVSLAKSYDLDWFPINYEVCDYYEMIGHMSYHGLPSHYDHWSYGKSFEKTHQMYNLGMEGLPYELIINTNPSIAYLMRENPLYLQVVIMAHCIGHSDFFKNNKEFKDTRPDYAVSRFRNAKKRIRKYIEDPSMGVTKVERILDNVHAIRFQTSWYDIKKETEEEKFNKFAKLKKEDKSGKYNDIDLYRTPIEPDFDVLQFLIDHGRHLSNWEKDLIGIVRDESHYFIPQIKTKIMNEGWASFWHYKILHELDVPQEIHIPFLKTHNQVIRPHTGKINPYNLGFHLFKKLEREKGLDFCFFVREVYNDISFLREFLDQEDMIELNMFSYSKKKDRHSIDEISDDDGWREIKQNLIQNTGMNGMPRIFVSELERSGVLVLEHEHDGRDLDLNYAERVVGHISDLWEDIVKLKTIIEEEEWEI